MVQPSMLSLPIKLVGYVAWSERICLRKIETKLDVQLVHE